MTRLSKIHILRAILALATSILKGQEKVEMIPYRIVPNYDIECPMKIEIIKPITTEGIPKIYHDELIEIFHDRIIFENTNQWAMNEIFTIDGKHYYLVRLPYSGYEGWTR